MPHLAQTTTGEWTMSAAVALLAAISLLALWWADAIRPGSFARGTRRDVSLLPWWGWLAAAAAMFVGQRLGATLGFSVAHAAGMVGAPSDTLPLAVQVIAGTGAYLVAIGTGAALLRVLAQRAEGGQARAAGLAFRASDPFIGLAWFLLAIPVVLTVMHAGTLAARWWSGEPPATIAHDTLRDIVQRRSDPWAWALVGFAVIGAPIAEELTYRVFLQSGMLALIRRTWPAIILTSALFAAVHFDVASWHALPGLFTFGLAMAIAYERSRSPGVPMVMHALFNAGMVAMALLSY